jgi:hypothetical protein
MLLRVGGGGLAIGCHAAVLGCNMMMMRRWKDIVSWLRGRDCVAVTIRRHLVEVVMVAEGGCHGWFDMEQLLLRSGSLQPRAYGAVQVSVIYARRERPQDMSNMPLVNATIFGRKYRGSDESIFDTSPFAHQPIGPSELLSIKVAVTTKQKQTLLEHESTTTLVTPGSTRDIFSSRNDFHILQHGSK